VKTEKHVCFTGIYLALEYENNTMISSSVSQIEY